MVYQEEQTGSCQLRIREIFYQHNGKPQKIQWSPVLAKNSFNIKVDGWRFIYLISEVSECMLHTIQTMKAELIVIPDKNIRLTVAGEKNSNWN